MVAPVIRRVSDERPLVEEIGHIYDTIRQRAFELFCSDEQRSSIENWLQAERETFWRPPVDLVAKDKSYVLQIAVPGLDSEVIDVRVVKGRLVIKAEKAHEHGEQNANVLCCEYGCGKLFREVELPEDADLDSASAKLDKGLLTITFPRVAAQTRKVPVTRIPVGAGT